MSLAVKQAPAADRVYSHVKQGVLERRYEGGTLLTEGELAEAVGVGGPPPPAGGGGRGGGGGVEITTPKSGPGGGGGPAG
ncbi:hypothetical protein ACFV5G_35430, partial [Streptomyces sp. NPDC059766]